MSVLRAIESKIEGLFEGVFGRAFRTNVQPIELARWLTKEMDLHRSVSVSRVYVPNEYTVYLAPSDRAQFASYEGSLIGELQEYLAEHARREGYALLTPAEGDLRHRPGSRNGRVRRVRTCRAAEGRGSSRSRYGTPAASTHAAAARRAGARAAARAVADDGLHAGGVGAGRPAGTGPEPEPPREVATLSFEGRDVPVTGDRVVLGRSRECDIRLVDANVSRRHAEVRQEEGDVLGGRPRLDERNRAERASCRAGRALRRRPHHARLDRRPLRANATVIGSIATDEALLVLKIAFLVLLYLFIWMIVRSATRDVRTAPQESIVLSAAEAAACARSSTDGKGRGLSVVSSPTLPAGRKITIAEADDRGRSPDCGLHLDHDDYVSSRHATLTPADERRLGRGSRLDERHVRQRRAGDDCTPAAAGRRDPIGETKLRVES